MCSGKNVLGKLRIVREKCIKNFRNTTWENTVIVTKEAGGKYKGN